MEEKYKKKFANLEDKFVSFKNETEGSIKRDDEKTDKIKCDIDRLDGQIIGLEVGSLKTQVKDLGDSINDILNNENDDDKSALTESKFSNHRSEATVKVTKSAPTVIKYSIATQTPPLKHMQFAATKNGVDIR